MLVVDDEESIRDMLCQFLELEGYQVSTANDGQEALDYLGTQPVDLVLTDLKMPRVGGIALLKELSVQAPGTLAVIMTGFGTVETAIDAMKQGAYDYILKPFKLDEVAHVIRRAIDKRQVEAENIRLREALSLYKVSEAISASLSLDEVMEAVAISCLEELDANLISTWLDDNEGGFAERDRICRSTPSDQLVLGEMDHRAVLSRLGSDQPLLAYGSQALDFFEADERNAAPRSFVAVPLSIKNRMIGFIAVASSASGRRFGEGHRKILSIIASRAAAAIENARLYSDLQGTFQQTIEGLAKAIDKMDRYTSGHSDCVAAHSVFIARRLGLAHDEVELIRQSAQMHDVGKIGCMLNLNKPGKLTDDEYEVFKRHPGYGRDILEPIKFLNPLIPGVHMHHERFDGRGYPLGRSGNDIPLMARVISVADTYDAMTSDRSYRRALPHKVALAEIKRCAGAQFDPEIAHSFLDGIEEFRAQHNSRDDKNSK